MVAATQKHKAVTTEKFIKSLPVPVPAGVVNWAASDHSGNNAKIATDAAEANYVIVGEPVFVGSDPNPDAPYTSTLLHYEVEVEMEEW